MVKILKQESALVLDSKGALPLCLVQCYTGYEVVGTRSALGPPQAPRSPNEAEKRGAASILDRTQPSALNVLSFHPGISECTSKLDELAKDRAIVALAGVSSKMTNDCLIAQWGQALTQCKLSLSSEDVLNGVVAGKELTVFLGGESGNVTWAVLNCHDYTDASILSQLLEYEIEVLVVVAYNPASRLFWEYAISDMHRHFCFVVVANVGELGGSGVFAPFRRVGRERNAQLSAGGKLFGVNGPSEVGVGLALDIAELRALRREFHNEGFAAATAQSKRDIAYAPMVPSEHFLETFDRSAGPPPVSQNDVRDVPNEWKNARPRIALAQLDHSNTYVETKYRIRNHQTNAEFEHMLTSRLLELEARVNLTRTDSPLLDMLVFPEVFVPRSFVPDLQRFSDRLGTTVIAGVDYPGTDESENANECLILRPHVEPVAYRKITRSQYDALFDENGGLMPLQRGQHLLRFADPDGFNFGVLICYDYSHFDLVHLLNTAKGRDPLDVLIIVAHNPFSSLYRSCCIADCHRFYQYVVMCNVAAFGGSGVFGPVRTAGARQCLSEIGKGSEAITITELDLAGLRAARRTPNEELHLGRFMRKPGLYS